MTKQQQALLKERLLSLAKVRPVRVLALIQVVHPGCVAAYDLGLFLLGTVR